MRLNDPNGRQEPDANDDFTGWLCWCGHWQDDEFHCDRCTAEPPWGCSCTFCNEEDEGEPDYEGSWDDQDFEED